MYIFFSSRSNVPPFTSLSARILPLICSKPKNTFGLHDFSVEGEFENTKKPQNTS